MKKRDYIKLGVIGFVSGISCGLFASGGGLILLPSLVHFLKKDEKEARAITVFCILPMVLVSLLFYNNSDYIDWKKGIVCAVGGCIGGVIGTSILDKLKIITLKIIFVIFLIISAIVLFNRG